MLVAKEEYNEFKEDCKSRIYDLINVYFAYHISSDTMREFTVMLHAIYTMLNTYEKNAHYVYFEDIKNDLNSRITDLETYLRKSIVLSEQLTA